MNDGKKTRSTRILLLRHGETAWNREEVFRGLADVPLNEAGRGQARALAAAIAPYAPAAVYSSPLSRAAETAEIVADGRGLSVVSFPPVVDIHCGAWEGRPLREIERDEPALFRQWAEAPQTFRFPGGESLDEVSDRAVKGLTDLARKHAGETIAVVSHRAVCKAVLCTVLGAGLAAFYRIVQSNACLNVLDWTGDAFRVVLLNDACHLAGTPWAPLAKDF
jgi:broad specificity phosphatase PhoE